MSPKIIEKMEEGLEHRLRGRPVRLIYDRAMPEDLLLLLASKLSLKTGELDPGARYHMMRNLAGFPRVRPDLENAVMPALTHPDIKPFSSILKVVRSKDILLHFPYHTFNHVVEFLCEAAIDPKVTDISITACTARQTIRASSMPSSMPRKMAKRSHGLRGADGPL